MRTGRIAPKAKNGVAADSFDCSFRQSTINMASKLTSESQIFALPRLLQLSRGQEDVIIRAVYLELQPAPVCT